VHLPLDDHTVTIRSPACSMTSRVTHRPRADSWNLPKILQHSYCAQPISLTGLERWLTTWYSVTGVTESGRTTVKRTGRPIYRYHLRRIQPQFVRQVSEFCLKASDGLESCTSEIQESEEFVLDGRQVMLVDTPRFGGTQKDNMDV